MMFYYKSWLLGVLAHQLLLAAISEALFFDNPNDDDYDAMDIVGKSPVELCQLRGFEAEEEYVTTQDGYKLQMIHMKNPHINQDQLKRPVLFAHGFIENANVYLVNSRGAAALPMENRCPELPVLENLQNFNRSQLVNGPMTLANRGFDVWLISYRGTNYSTHETLTPEQPEYWNFTLDDIALIDVKTAIDHIIEETGAKKIGFVGHSQGTFSSLSLLSTRPEYGDIIEPVVMVAPIAFLGNITSIGKVVAESDFLTNLEVEMPFPPFSGEIRELLFKFCDSRIERTLCSLLIRVIAGKGQVWPRGIYSCIPISSSYRVGRQFAQIYQSNKMQMFDFGPVGNKEKYGIETAPEYPLGNITSKSIFMINAKADTLSASKDVERLKSVLRDEGVEIFGAVTIEREDINHFDMLLAEEGSKLVFAPTLEVFEEFERQTGSCAQSEE